MDIRALRYFLEIAREHSFTRAALGLCVSQPALSKQMKELEEELGVELFRRRNRRMELTEAGELLRLRAADILGSVAKAKEDLQSFRNEAGGDISIGAGESDGVRLAIRAMKDFLASRPRVRLHWKTGNAETLCCLMDRGLVDFSLVYTPPDPARYESFPLPAKETWGVLAPESHRLAELDTVPPEALKGLPLIISREGLRGDYQKWFGPMVERLNIVADYDLAANAILMAQEGMGCLLAFDKALPALEGTGLVFRPMKPRLENQLYVVWRRNQELPPAARLLIGCLSQRFSRKDNDEAESAFPS